MNTKQIFNKNGFTLIELLVVISIVSLLASIVLASVNSARERGRIAAARSFASQVEHLAGDQLMAKWDFDECSGATATDTSGFNNNGTIVGSLSWSTNTPSGSGCSLSFNGSAANYVSVSDSTSLDLANNFTVSVWVYLNASTNAVILTKGSSSLYGAYAGYGYGPGGFVYGAYNSSNAPGDISRGSDVGRWHNIIGVDDGTTRYIYIDGKLVGSTSASGSVDSWNNSNTLFIGKGESTTGPVNGLIDEIRVYAKTLTASEIHKLYAEGLEDRTLLAQGR